MICHLCCVSKPFLLSLKYRQKPSALCATIGVNVLLTIVVAEQV